MDYPMPIAEPPEIKRVQELYLRDYNLTLSYAEAKDLLERVMQFIYLTEMGEVEKAMHDLKRALEE